ncbi:MAG TPA: hypothetical protein VF384_16280 [Planctomycetota bacterium]
MHRVFRSAAAAWVAAGLMGCAALVSAVRGTERAVATETERAVAATPRWVLPQERARALANSEGRPLLLVSLNGNLDGYC